jgi:hypothetical protein
MTLRVGIAAMPTSAAGVELVRQGYGDDLTHLLDIVHDVNEEAATATLETKTSP